MLPCGRLLLRPSHGPTSGGMLLVEFPSKNSVRNLKSPVLQRCSACYAPDMTPHERCLQVLAAVVQFDDANGIILVEQAIDALIQAAGTDSVSKILALDELTEDLTVNGWNTGLAGVIREYIARQRELVIRDDSN
jgi:hypothetical protein